METRNFCTLADSNYRAKLLAMHQSLREHIPDFHLYILCLDDALVGLLGALAPKNVTLIHAKDFIDPVLRSKRTNRTYVEWLWTMTPSLVLYVLEKWPHLKEIAYVDADLFFYSSPEPMYDEIGAANSMVIPHRFPPGRDKSENGLFNVSLVWWRNVGQGTIDHLFEWRGLCLDWCHCWPSKGRFADQGYLNNWPEKWGSHVLEHIGCNVAPWSMKQYEYSIADDHNIVLRTPGALVARALVFFHFHEFKITNEFAHDFYRCNYERPPFVDRHIYPQYERALKEQIERIRPYVQSTR